jgi:site-specific DNA-methyltransferase (adenine-specific)
MFDGDEHEIIDEQISEDLRLIRADNRAVVEALADDSVDGVITDPPYENQAFNRVYGVTWDKASGAHDASFWPLLFPKMKPGAWLAVFAGGRTSWKMAAALDAAGFEIFDSFAWIYGSGQTKGAKLPDGKAIFLRPAHEIIWLARKPLKTTYIKMHEQYGTGGFNIDEARFNTFESAWGSTNPEGRGAVGRYPMNVMFTHTPLCERVSVKRVIGPRVPAEDSGIPGIFGLGGKPGKMRLVRKEDEYFTEWACAPGCPLLELERQRGREVLRKFVQLGWGQYDFMNFQYTPKPQSPEREAGAEAFLEAPHITMKPVELGRHLIRLLVPRGGTVMDPYAGSATFGVAAFLEGRKFIGVERMCAAIDSDFPYFEFGLSRLRLVNKYGEAWMEGK